MTPSKKKQTAFRIDDDIMLGLQHVKERDGIPIYNRANLRKARRGYLTSAEERRVNTLQARINEIDGIGTGGAL